MNGEDRQNKELDNLEVELLRLKARLESSHNEELKADIANKISQIRSMQSSVNERANLIKEKDDLDKEKAKIDKELPEKYEERENLSKDREISQSSYDMWSKFAKDTAERIAQQETSLKEAQDRKNEIENDENMSPDEKSKLIEDLHLDRTIDTASANSTNWRESLEENENHVEEYAERLNNIDEDIADINKEIDETEKRREELPAKSQELDQKIKDNTAEVDNFIAALQSSMDDLQKAFSAEAEVIKAEAEASAEKWEADRRAERKRVKAEVKAEVDGLKQFKRNLSRDSRHTPIEINDLREMKTFKESIVNSVGGINDSLDNDLAALTQNPAQNNLNKIKSNADNMNMIIGDLEKNFQKEIDKDKKQLAEKQKYADDLAAKYKKELAKLEKKEKDLSNKVHKLDKEFSKISDEVTEENEKVNSGKSRSKTTLHRKQNKQEKVEAEFDKAKDERSEVRAQIEKIKNEIEVANKVAKSVSVKIRENERAMRHALSPLKNKIKEINEAAASIENQAENQNAEKKGNVIQISVENAMAKKGIIPIEQHKTQKQLKKPNPASQKTAAAPNL